MGCMKTLRLLCFVLEAGACCVAQTDPELTIHLSYTHGVAHVRLHWFLFSWTHFNEVVHTLQLQKTGTEQLKQQSQRNSMRVNIRVLYFKLMCVRGEGERERRGEKRGVERRRVQSGVEIRGQLSGVDSSTVRVSRTEVRYQAWWQFPLPDEPSQQPFLVYFSHYYRVSPVIVIIIILLVRHKPRRSENNFMESVFCFHFLVGSKGRIQVMDLAQQGPFCVQPSRGALNK